MGYQTALGIAETNISLEQQVSWHFSSNCYPPVPQQMIPVAVTAIKNVLGEKGSDDINLPDGVSYRGATTVTGYQAVESYRLWAFVYAGLEGEDE